MYCIESTENIKPVQRNKAYDPSTLLPLKINFPWSVVALQCCVSFCSTAKWISHTCTYVPLFLDFLPIYVTVDHWVELPVLHSGFSLLSDLYVVSTVYLCQSPSPTFSQIPLPSWCPHVYICADTTAFNTSPHPSFDSWTCVWKFRISQILFITI